MLKVDGITHDVSRALGRKGVYVFVSVRRVMDAFHSCMCVRCALSTENFTGVEGEDSFFQGPLCTKHVKFVIFMTRISVFRCSGRVLRFGF